MKFKSLLFSALVSFGALSEAAVFNYTSFIKEFGGKLYVSFSVPWNDNRNNFAKNRENIKKLFKIVRSQLKKGFDICETNMTANEKNVDFIEVFNTDTGYTDSEYKVFVLLTKICNFSNIRFYTKRNIHFGVLVLCNAAFSLAFMYDRNKHKPVYVEVIPGAGYYQPRELLHFKPLYFPF